VSRSQRLGLVVLAVVIAVAAFLIARPSNDEDESAGTGSRPAQTETGDAGTRTEREPQPPQVARIVLRGGAPRGGVRTIRASTGETVQIVVASDAPDEIHVHGYDITRMPEPGRPARFRFTADVEGVFEIESHVAEDAGREPLVARLVVEPS
jgi:FtsP/CotA-like multicopper oxidase with cupredoxin domain